MKKILLLFLILGLFAGFSANCVGFQYGIPANTVIYNSATSGMSGTANDANMKEARSCVSSWIGYFAIGDISVAKVAAKQGITKVASVSYEYDMKQLINQAFCVVIRGN